MDFAEPHFAEPLRLWALPLVAVFLATLLWRAAKVRRKALASVASPTMLAHLLRGHSPARGAVKTAVFVAALALILLALARPRWGVTTSEKTHDTEDIVFLLDTSRSMTARDVAPTRLDRAKLAIDTFVGSHPSGRVGLVAFAGEAFLQCPPTADRDIFRDTLDALDTTVIPTPGTDIGAALEEGVAAFGDQKGRRTLILLTDGEDLSGQGVEIAKKLGADGVLVHTVGIGGAGYQIPDSKGGTVTTRLDESTLKDIAHASGGEFFRLGGPGDTFASVENGLERTVSASGEDRIPIERYGVTLALAAILLAAEALLGTRRKLPLAGLAKTAALLLVAGFSIHDARAESPGRLYDLGADALKRAQFREAEDYLKNSLADADDALRPLALHNLAQARARGAMQVLEKRESPLEKINLLKNSTVKPTEFIDKLLSAGAEEKLDEQTAALAIQSGKAVRKDIRKKLPEYLKTVAEGEVLIKALERARDDFRGARELNPADTDATKNADAIETILKRLKPEEKTKPESKPETADKKNEEPKPDQPATEQPQKQNEDKSQKPEPTAKENDAAGKPPEQQLGSDMSREQPAADATQKASSDLKQKIKELSKRLKKQKGEQSGEPNDEDEDDDDEDEKEKDPKDQKGSPDKRSEEQRRKDEGKSGRMTREEAQAALESMNADMRRKLQFGKPADPEAVKRARETGNDR